MKSRKLHAVLSAVLTVLHFRLVTLLVVPSKVSNYPAKTIFNEGPIYNAIVIHINMNNALKVPKLMVIIKNINRCLSIWHFGPDLWFLNKIKLNKIANCESWLIKK